MDRPCPGASLSHLHSIGQCDGDSRRQNRRNQRAMLAMSEHLLLGRRGLVTEGVTHLQKGRQSGKQAQAQRVTS